MLELMAALGRPAVAAEPAEQRAVYQAYLADPNTSVFVAELDGDLVGAAGLVVRARLNWPTAEAWIPDLVVLPDHRRRGAGRALLDACTAHARSRGCHLLRLDCGVSRSEARALYEVYGFVRAGYDFQLRLNE